MLLLEKRNDRFHPECPSAFRPGKGASRRLRRNAALVPAVIYGGDKAPQSISILAKDLAKLLENKASFSHVLSMNVDGQTESVLIKALQRHPAKASSCTPTSFASLPATS